MLWYEPYFIKVIFLFLKWTIWAFIVACVKDSWLLLLSIYVHSFSPYYSQC